MNTSFLTLLLFVFCFVPQNPDHFRSQTAMTLWFILAMIAFKLKDKLHWSAALMFLLCSISAANITFSKHPPFMHLGIMNVIAMDGATAQSLLWLLVVTLFLVLTSIDVLKKLERGFGVAIFISSLMMLYHYFFTSIPPVGILDNHAIDATFVAVAIPSMYNRPLFNKYLYLFFPIMAVLVAKSNTGIMLLSFQLVCYLLAKKKKIPVAVICGAGVFLLAYKYFLGWKFLDDNGRYVIWRWAYEYWVGSGKLLFGLGSGTYQLLGPIMQQAHQHIIYFIWMHNEFLQVLFEQGIVGLIIAIMTFGFALKTAKKPYLKLSLGTIFMACFTQFPFRMMPICLFCAIILKLAFRDNASGRA